MGEFISVVLADFTRHTCMQKEYKQVLRCLCHVCGHTMPYVRCFLLGTYSDL